ncbi:zinc-binding alcohol dehydrogenase family protein [Spirosoma montaniterrae]|uniref:NADPH:quinone reductase n=1 Tax=Spirosoma montaniterrae TaxID=1178516 RepID=A0A1P9WTD5_9BACT|nr:zinc-binding alcohol dehydrogenase family protein [Spirosoma montaniterrae]AQG78632.1 NADPH:quinone reductase [Spirosoma montaniterrae]
MKAAILYNPGAADQFRLEERPIPTPQDGQVLIRVKAFGLNRSELMTRKGLSPNVRFPRVLGIECVGEVAHDPTGEYAPGQQVAALMGGMGRDFDGSYAEYTVVPTSIIYPFRSTLSWAQLGAIPEMFQTVYGSLQLSLRIQPGETVLIRGGTSSVGMLATQLAKNEGLTVLTTTRNGDKKALLVANGADYVLIDDGNLRGQVRSIFPQGVDKVLELVGASTLQDSLQCVRPGGTACMTGMLSETWSIDNFAPMEFIPATVHLTIYDSGQIRSSPDVFQQFINDVETGRVKLTISQVFRLDEIAQAHRLMEQNQASGKIVVLT